MKKSKLILPFLTYLFTRTSIITKALYHAVVGQKSRDVAVKKYGVTHLRQIDLLDIFPQFGGKVELMTFLYGTSMPIDMVILRTLAGSFTNCDYLEIGTWRGESLANVAPLCNKAVSVSLSNEQMKERGFDENFVRVQRLFSKEIPNVVHHGADSTAFDFTSLNQKFDLIFVDGDHSFDGVKNDTRKVFNLLKNEDSIIIWHDYVSQYELINWEVFAGILDGLPEEHHADVYHISNSYCAIYTNKKFATRHPEFPAMPNKIFQLELTCEKIG